MDRRRVAICAQTLLLVLSVGVTVWSTRADDWTPAGLFVLLLGLAVASEALAIETNGMHLSGAFLAIVLSMCFLGPGPAVATGLAVTLFAFLRRRPTLEALANNLATFVTFPLIGGLLVRVARNAGWADSDTTFALTVVGVYTVSMVLNFLLIGGEKAYVDRIAFHKLIRQAFLPVLPSEAAIAMVVLLFTLVYRTSGVPALAMLAGALFAFQWLTRALLQSQERSEQLAVRTTQLASLQVGVLAALVQTLSLRDKMTARHSAAVARYARAIAEAIGCSRDEQELVHTAGLLHDIGKFIFPDRILFADSKLTDEDWIIVQKHPAQGARVVARVEGYGPVADIIRAHHERIDGNGYPNGLAGDDIPLLSRMISIADTYDVMTARDSYRKPVPPEEAIAELRRVSGKQLDGTLVEVFIRILEQRGVSFQHTTDADFEHELGFEGRVRAFLEAPAA